MERSEDGQPMEGLEETENSELTTAKEIQDVKPDQAITILEKLVGTGETTSSVIQ